MTVGPVEIFVIAFDDPKFHGEIRAELERLRDGDIIRLVDLLAVRKTEDGVIESIQRSDLERRRGARVRRRGRGADRFRRRRRGRAGARGGLGPP